MSLLKVNGQAVSRNQRLSDVEPKTEIMLRLKLSAPYEQVYVFISLENPLTGQMRTIDAKVDRDHVDRSLI